MTTIPEELSKFLKDQAAQLDAESAAGNAPSFETMRNKSSGVGVKPMPPEFQLRYPRRLRWSGWYEQPNGEMAHFIGSRDATAEEEAWHRINAPERGLTPEDRAAYRKSQRGPVAKFFVRLKFWPSKAKDEGEFEVPQWLRK